MKKDDVNYMGPEVEKIRNSFIDSEFKFRTQNPSWKRDHDARLTVFNKISHVLSTVNINFVLRERHLIKKGWWKANSNIPVSESNAKLLIYEFDMFNRLGLINFVFSSVESSLRLFLFAIDQTACNSSKDDIKNVYDCLFKKLNLQKYVNLLDIWRNVRNSLHTNGLFIPRNHSNNQPIEFEGVIYNFEVGKPLEFINTTVMIDLMPSILEMLDQIINSPDILNIPEIIDPSASIDPVSLIL